MSRLAKNIGFFLVLVLSAAQGCAEIKSRRVLTAILMMTPAAELVPSGLAMKVAEQVSKQRDDSYVLWGVGDSMQPLYAHGTAVIVAEHDYERLKKGMTVVYLNRHGMRVAHCIVGETRGGYLMQGVSNPKEDHELLTKDNFMGVVIAAYSSTQTDFREVTLAKLPPKSRALLAKSEFFAKNKLPAKPAYLAVVE